MLPQCSHITKKRGVFYYRRRLPKPLTGELALSLRTKGFREAEWLARVLDAAFPRMLRRMNDAKNRADINRIAREYLRGELDLDMELRAKPSQRPVYGYFYFDEDAKRPDPVAADLAWINLELETAEKELAKRLYEERRGIIDMLMEEHQVPEDQWNDLAFAIFCARIKKWEIIRKRTLGNLDDLDFAAASPSPSANAVTETPQETGPLLSSVLPGFIDLMVKEDVWRGQTLAQNKASYRMFQECCGDRPVASYQRKDFANFYELLRSLPKLYSKSAQWRDLPLAHVADQSRELDVERLTMKTIKRHFSALGRLFAHLKRHGEITGENPAYGFEFPDRQRAKEKREDWPSDQLTKLFMSPVWTGCQSESRRSRPGNVIVKDEKYWLPILGVYHGNRLEEFAQLRREDVKCEDGIHYLDINDEGPRQLKNAQSNRRVPIHRAVLQMGFLQYVESTAPNPGDLVFPLLRPGGPDSKLGYHFTKWWSRYRKDVGLYNPKLNYHSFRHNVTTKLAEEAVSLELRNELLGREGQSTDERVYLKRLPLRQLADAINRIDWPELAHLLVA